MPFHKQGTKSPYARVLFIGEPGMGKTLLASTLEETLILDLEGRAAHANRPTWTFTKDRAGLQELQTVLKQLSRLRPQDDGALHYNILGEDIPIRAVQIDSLDELQLNIDLAISSRGFDYWREMLELMRGVLTVARTINAHLFCVAHTREYSSETKNLMPRVDLALQGQASQQVPRWFDIILNMMYDPVSRQPMILTQPTVVAGKLYWAKDSHWQFGGRNMPLTFSNGRPDKGIMDKILEATSGGLVEPMSVDNDKLIKKLEGELEDATSQPIPSAQFLATCNENGWDMSEGGRARELLVAEFGPGYNPARGMTYIEFLREHYKED